ncbi:hypothetical protein K8W59_05695 [Nocardioides rotundus]|uniref:ribonuclease domain-containing protein n=1 Tax=Nocardioides rotundus TaxID=1774216 RepID=UPI001CBC6A47|nr:ribonuclease domain-containing protein [Nocardioides rotundus]UAL30986.1 hypothetical protein K8W59_05695 [Nocardioides rotundus]
MANGTGTGTGSRGRRSLVGLLIAIALAVVVWWTQGDDAARDPSAAPSSSASAEAQPSPTPTEDTEDSATSDPSETSSTVPTDDGGTDPDSGLPWVAEADLPPEAIDTLALIDADGPYPYEEDDTVFSNREGILPDEAEGYYREYTVETPGLDHRGAKRIVTGSGGEYYWTEDHYSSFARIRREGS